MYVAVLAGQDQYIKTTAKFTGTDGSSRSVNIDGLSFTTSQPSCFANNSVVKTATTAGVSLKYAKVASETGKKCAMKTVFNLAAGETPTQKVDFMIVTEYTCSSAMGSARISNSEQFSKGIAADKVADYISRNSGRIESSCSVE